MGQIYLIRHGQASFGSDNYDELSDLGHEQGRLLGQWFANNGQRFHRVVTGSLKRHRQTADACISQLPKTLRLDIEYETDPGFNEYDHHDNLIRHRPDLAEPGAIKRFFAETQDPRRAFQRIHESATARWMGGEYDGDYHEPWPAFRDRCVAALKRLTDSAEASQNIPVFTSGGTIATLCQHVLELNDAQMAKLSWSFVNASVTKLLYRPGMLSLSYLNNYSHLEWLGPPEAVTYR